MLYVDMGARYSGLPLALDRRATGTVAYLNSPVAHPPQAVRYIVL